MVGTMLPIGYGERLHRRVPMALFAYAFASVGASVLAGISLGFIGVLWPTGATSHSSLTLVCGAVALVYGCADAGGISLPRLQRRRQVPTSWYRRYAPVRVGVMYGGVLGFGFATWQPVSTLFVVAAWAVIRGEPVWGALVMGAYGLGQCVPLAWISRTNAGDLHALESIVDRLISSRRLMQVANGLLLVAVGAYVTATALL